MSAPAGLPLRGDPRPLRVLGRQLTGDGCPARTWLDMRPGIRPDLADWSIRRPPWPFFLSLVGAAGQPDLSGLHPGVARFVRHARESYAEVLDRRCLELGVTLRPADERVIEAGGRRLEAWALCYDSPDRRIREVHRLRYRSPRGDSAEDRRWAAVAAKLAVDGTRNGCADRDPDPDRVLVVEVGLLGGEARVVFDGGPPQARAYYDELALPLIRSAADRSDYLPSRDCGDCRWVSACPAVPRLPGVLGLAGPGVASRSVSMSDLLAYRRCPASYFLSRVAHLPGEDTPTEAQQRGLAVHKLLAEAHQGPDRAPCTAATLPEDPELAAYLAGHLDHCPLGFDGLLGMTAEPSLYAYDPVADVVVAARPDLAFRTLDGRQIWRETKTTTAPLPPDPEAALAAFPAAALDVLLLAALAGPDGSVELEVLTPAGARVYPFAAADPGVRAAAHRELAPLVTAWHHDSRFAASPGDGCRSCPVRRWCPDATG